MDTKQVTLRVLFYQEGDQWIAQCVDYDLTAHGESLGLAHAAFEKAVIAEIVVCLQHDRVPFELGQQTVPPMFVQAFEDVLAERLEKRNISVPPGVLPAHVIGAIAADRRIAERF